jgi:uncharacterized OsmC-like protein
VSVRALEDGAFEWSNSTAHQRLRRDGPEAIRAVDLLLASLGMCVSGTIRAYAAHHAIESLESVDVELLGEEVGPPSRLESATITISLVGNLSEEDVKRLRRAGQHCKIHNTLSAGIEVRIV